MIKKIFFGNVIIIIHKYMIFIIHKTLFIVQCNLNLILHFDTPPQIYFEGRFVQLKYFKLLIKFKQYLIPKFYH